MTLVFWHRTETLMWEELFGILVFVFASPFAWIAIGIVDLVPYDIVAITWAFAAAIVAIWVVSYLKGESRN